MGAALDTWPVMRFLEGDGVVAPLVREVLRERPVMSWVNLGEVFYLVRRAAGEVEAQRTIGTLRRTLTLDVATPERTVQAARIKADHAMSYADAFAAATAVAHRAELWTGDPELLVEGAPWAWRDLRG